jgi:predicted MFS family arabinose efflux permease
MPYLNSFQAMAALTLIVGLGMGALYALVMAILSDSDEPDRAFGLKLGLETVPGAALLFLLPVAIVPAYGFAGVTAAMAVSVLVLGIAGFFLPVRGVRSIGPTAPLRLENLWLSVFALLASLSFFTGISASWAFLELLADTRSLPAGEVGTALAVAFVICGIGGFIAAIVADRFGRIVPVVSIIVINWAGLWQLSVFANISEYAIGSSLFLFSVNFALAYTFGLTAKVDTTGRMVVLSAAVLSIGAAIGPATAGRIIEAGSYDGMLVFSAACSLMALIFYSIVCRFDRGTVY